MHTERTVRDRARSSADTFERVIFEMSEDGVTGRGEAAPTSYYGQDAQGVATALESVEVWDPWDIEGSLAHQRRDATFRAHGPRQRHARPRGQEARRAGLPFARSPDPYPSRHTPCIADRETTVAHAQRLSKHRILKVKVGGWKDIETLRAVRESSEAELWVDANEAFPRGGRGGRRG